jgi:Holliday junction DNA helicase RuvB
MSHGGRLPRDIPDIPHPPIKAQKPLEDWRALLDSHIGQKRFKAIATIHIEHCIAKRLPFPHILFYGNSGLGKTTLAELIAKCLGGRFRETTGGALNRVCEMQELIQSIEPGNVILVDEIHNLGLKSAEEAYSVMASFRWQGRDVPPFTLVGATTDAGDIPRPLFRRFLIDIAMEPYTREQIAAIVQRHFEVIDNETAKEISARSFGIPALALKYARHVDAAEGRGVGDIFELLGVDSLGLNERHLAVLEFLVKQNKPVSFQAIQFYTDIVATDLRNLYEAQLLRLGFLVRTPRGREITTSGREYLEGNKA